MHFYIHLMPESNEAHSLGGAHMEQVGRRPFGHISQIKFGDQWDARNQSSLILSDSSASPAPDVLYLFIPSILFLHSEIFIEKSSE